MARQINRRTPTDPWTARNKAAYEAIASKLTTKGLTARSETPSGRRRVFSASSASRNPRNIPDIPPVSLLDLAKNPSPSARKDFHHGLLRRSADSASIATGSVRAAWAS